jgi:uncharacterized protein YbjT (DUF2867 family)
MTPVFVTGATGYLGRPLIAALLARGDDVHALVTRREMVAALLHAVVNPPASGARVVEVPEIRRTVE